MILKEGDKPTMITVKRGNDEWKIDEKGVAELPDDIRPHVERMLHGMAAGSNLAMPQFDFMPNWQTRAKPPTGGQPRAPIRSRLEQRMDQMSRQIERLEQFLRQQHKERGPEEEK
jgi:hypothetical protein